MNLITDEIESMKKFNHDTLQEFLTQTEFDTDDAVCCVKATMCQFLMNTKRGVIAAVNKNGDKWIDSHELILLQITELRRCIVDLNQHLTNLEVGKQ